MSAEVDAKTSSAPDDTGVEKDLQNGMKKVWPITIMVQGASDAARERKRIFSQADTWLKSSAFENKHNWDAEWLTE